MLRFLKKRVEKSRKFFQRPVPPENPTRQVTDTGATCGQEPDGEHRLGKISEVMKPMGLIIAPDLNHGGGSRIATGGGGIGDQQLSTPDTSTPNLIPGDRDDNLRESCRVLPSS